MHTTDEQNERIVEILAEYGVQGAAHVLRDGTVLFRVRGGMADMYTEDGTKRLVRLAANKGFRAEVVGGDMVVIEELNRLQNQTTEVLEVLNAISHALDAY